MKNSDAAQTESFLFVLTTINGKTYHNLSFQRRGLEVRVLLCILNWFGNHELSVTLKFNTR